MLYNLAGIGDSSTYSTALTEVWAARAGRLSIRSSFGLAVGAVSPWRVRLVLDATRARQPVRRAVWGLA
jgi:hypothetical protein